MSDSATLANCQFCSVISKANGDDPIGTAGTYDAFLLIEAKPPWPGAIWIEAGAMPQQVVDAMQHAWDRGLNFRPLAIAPDREYSQPGSVRVLFYHRPAKQFAEFERQEYVIPLAQLGALVTAILHQPDDLPQFASYQQTGTVRDLLVCTHGNYDVACSRFGYPIYKKLRTEYANVWRGAKDITHPPIHPSTHPPIHPSTHPRSPSSLALFPLWRTRVCSYPD
jgi:hypothetical protein